MGEYIGALKIGKIFDDILEAIFPTNIYCICCGNLINNSRKYGLCDTCMEEIQWVKSMTCSKCGKIFKESETGNGSKIENDFESLICDDCQNNTHYFDKAFTCMIYGTKEKEIIHQYKYGGKAYMGEQLGKLLLERIILEGLELDVVTAVPMHPKKLKKRGYNQAELMARVVARGIGVEYSNRILKRDIYKAPMNKMGKSDRMTKILGAYSAYDDKTEKSDTRKLRHNRRKDEFSVSGKSVLLVDDVYTTGSTADECSKILRELGAEKIYVLTLASGAQAV